MMNLRPRAFRATTFARSAAVLAVSALALTACSHGSGNSAASSAGGKDKDKVGVSLIVKTTSNPYFVTMGDSAKKEAAKDNVDLTLAAGKEDGDEQGQIQAIENAISRGDKGILIIPNGPSVVDALGKAKQAGIEVIALDTVPDPADAADITYATDNFAAGKSIGEWTAAKLDGKKAVIGLVDLFSDKAVSVDYNRDQGFLSGMGIDVKDKNKNGDEDKTGHYSGGKGGEYVIAGSEPSQGAEDGGRTAAENLLSKNPDINVMYAINEPAAYGAYQALKAAGKDKSTLLVTIDGGCTGVDQVAKGMLNATAQQYPSKMSEMGVDAIAKLVRTGAKPKASDGLDFVNTGSKLVTNDPQQGVPSIDTKQASQICWGK